MAVIQGLENEFADRVIDRRGLKLFRPADAAEYVARCAEHGIEVLGIDGFRVSGESIQPLISRPPRRVEPPAVIMPKATRGNER